MSIQWNWGTKIMLVYIAFVLFMLSFVFFSTQQQFDLVTPDYYEEELKYQNVIDGQRNTQALGSRMQIAREQDMLVISLPTLQNNEHAKINFYRPDNAKLDFVVPVGANGRVTVPAKKLASGMYKVKASWTVNGKNYYDELEWMANK